MTNLDDKNREVKNENKLSAAAHLPPRTKREFYLQFDVNLWGNCRLSKNARHLHITLLRLADAKTGELRIRTHWFTPAEVEREAEMSHNTRKKAMRELLNAGLADRKRD